MLSTTRYRCRGCGAYFRMTATGWLITVGVIVAEIFWYVLFRAGMISAYVAIGLVLVTCILATFGLPYVTPVRGHGKRRGKKSMSNLRIIAPNRFQRIEEHEKILRGLLAQRAHEWRAQRGIRRWITRIRIEFWAWEETAREQRRIHKDDSRHRL